MSLTRASQDAGEQWYIAQLKPGGFERAVTNLTRQGFESFMPMREETRRRAGRWDKKKRPLFPGYLFVKVSENNRQWASINGTFGVSRLVSLEAGRPTPVASSIIAALQDRMSGDGILQSSTDLKAGDRVRIVSGPFSDMFADIEAVPEQGRIFVFLDMMGRCAKTLLAAADVEAA